MGDAGEMLVAAELTLAGVPALRVPDIWPGYDVIAQPPGKKPRRISVKTRSFAKSGHFVGYAEKDVFDWLAIVILPGLGCAERRIFIVPRRVADERAHCAPHRAGKGFYVHKLVKHPEKGTEGLADFENNFALKAKPAASSKLAR
jgi:hypothetical protein